MNKRWYITKAKQRLNSGVYDVVIVGGPYVLEDAQTCAMYKAADTKTEYLYSIVEHVGDRD